MSPALSLLSRSSDGESTRAQSEVVGYVLLVGLVVTVVTVTVALGNAAIVEHEQTANVEQAERALRALDAEASRVALGASDVQQLELGLQGNGGTVDVEPRSGWLRVQIVSVDTGGVKTTVVNATMGTVVYENGDTTVAYQAGGVWRTDDGHAVMVSPPPVDYRRGSLTLPVITVGGGSIYNDIQIAQATSPARKFPNASANASYTNPLQNEKLVVTVKSDYYEAWAQFFREETNGYVWTNESAETVSVSLFALPEYFAAADGISATSGNGELALTGNGAYTDSYNSEEGTYSESQSGDGTIWSAGSVMLSGDAEVNGSVYAGKAVKLESNSAKISGNVNYTTEFVNKGTVTGCVTETTFNTALPRINSIVDRTVAQLHASNDNDETPVIDRERISLTDGEYAELGPGAYYLETLRVENSNLVLNTTGNRQIILALDDWTVIEDGGNLTVKGNGTVRIYAAAERETTVKPTGLGSSEVNFHVGKGSDVNVPDQDSPQFQIYATEQFVATIAGSNSANGEATFDGVIYAPSGGSGGGYVYTKQAEVYGSVVAADVTLGQYGVLHYDRALNDMTYPPGPTVSRIGFLHVTVHRINVTST